MSSPADDLVGQAARRGLLDEPTVRKSLAGALATPERIVALGVSCSRCGRALVAEGSAIACRPCGVRVELTPPSAERYEKKRRLGQGGFGEVWLALDRELGREVALKFLTSASPDDLARFKREARLAAKLSHPNIVAVHDVGDRMLVMDFIPGAPADEVPLFPRGAAEIARQAAEAVAYAHGQGVIHRDLKPDNILVAGGKAYVADFGLAKSLGTESSLSLSGELMGTPSYMAPEQARGKLSQVGPWSDVYALGATLYALLAGRPPFRAADVYGTIRQVIEEEPRSLRTLNPKVDRDLEVVVAKAMAKEPGQRYASAAELAADLARYLGGEAVRARPASLSYRLRKRVRRNPWAWGLGTAAVVLGLAGAVGTAVFSTKAHEVRLSREAEQALGTAREAMEDWLAERLGPRHDVSPQRRKLAEAADGLRRSLEIHPEEHPVRGTLGWVLHEMGRYGEAEAELARAVAGDPDEGSYRYWLGRVRLAIYERELARAMRQADERSREQEKGRIAGIRKAGIDEVRRAVAAPRWRTGRAWDRDYARVLVMVEEGRAEEAQRACENMAARHSRGGEEFWILRGDLYPATSDGLSERVASYDRAGDHARSYSRAFELGARWRSFQGHFVLLLEGDPVPIFEEAVRRADAAIEIDPEGPGGYVARAMVRHNQAALRNWSGADLRELYPMIVGDWTRAMDLDPSNAEAAKGRGEARHNWGVYLMEHGEDPATLFEEALADFDRSLALHRELAETYVSRGLLGTSWGKWLAGRGGNPTPRWEEAIGDLDRAIELAPDSWEAFLQRGRARAEWGLFLQDRRRDPTERIREAIDDLTRAAELYPLHEEPLVRRGLAWSTLGMHLAAIGEDPSDAYDRALADHARVLEMNPRSAEALLGIGSVRVNRGVAVANAGGDAGEEFEAAVGEFGRAVEIEPGRVEAWVFLGHAEIALARTRQYLHGEDPAAGYARAESALTRALSLNPLSSDALWRRGQCRLWAGNPRGAVEDLEAAIRIDPALEPFLEGALEEARRAAGEF